MSEQLAIRTDDNWANGAEKVIRTLTPRGKDHGKRSSWAHYSSEDGNPSIEIVSDPGFAPRILQALVMFFGSELRRKVDEAPRSAIRGVSLSRETFTEDLIENDRQPHLIFSYGSLHRSLLLGDPKTVEKVALEITEKKSYEPWKYSRRDLAKILRLLLDQKCVAQDLEADARSILAQWESAS